MAGITLEQAQAQLDAYLIAETKVLSGQAYELSTGRSLTRANLAEIRKGIEIWDRRVKDLSAKSSGRGRCVTVVPRW